MSVSYKLWTGTHNEGIKPLKKKQKHLPHTRTQSLTDQNTASFKILFCNEKDNKKKPL